MPGVMSYLEPGRSHVPLRYLAHDFRSESTNIEIKLHDQRC